MALHHRLQFGDLRFEMTLARLFSVLRANLLNKRGKLTRQKLQKSLSALDCQRLPATKCFHCLSEYLHPLIFDIFSVNCVVLYCLLQKPGAMQ